MKKQIIFAVSLLLAFFSVFAFHSKLFAVCTAAEYASDSTAVTSIRSGEMLFRNTVQNIPSGAIAFQTRGNLTRANDRIYFFDTDSNVVRKFRGGVEERSIRLGREFYATYGIGFGTEIAVDKHSNIYFYSYSPSAPLQPGLYVRDRSGTVSIVFEANQGGYVSKMRVVNNKLYVATWPGALPGSGNGKIIAFDLSFSSLPVDWEDHQILVEGIHDEYGFAVDGKGFLYYGIVNSYSVPLIKRRNPRTEAITTVMGGGVLSVDFDTSFEDGIKDMAVDRCGNLLVATRQYSNPGVGIFRLNFAENIVEPLPDFLPENSRAVSIELDGDNYLYIVTDITPLTRSDTDSSFPDIRDYNLYWVGMAP